MENDKCPKFSLSSARHSSRCYKCADLLLFLPALCVFAQHTLLGRAAPPGQHVEAFCPRRITVVPLLPPGTDLGGDGRKPGDIFCVLQGRAICFLRLLMESFAS